MKARSYAAPVTVSRARRDLGRVQIVAAGLLLCLASACDDRSPAAPTPAPAQPPPAVPAAPAPSAAPQARGWITDTAFRPVSGVRIDVVDGPTAGASGTSGPDGSFYVSVPLDQEFVVRATKAGYVDAVAAFTTYSTSYGIFFRGYLTISSSDAPVVFEPGAYTVTLDFPCSEIPADLRTQTFQATVTTRPNAPPGTNFIVVIDDERFGQFKFNGFEFGVSGSVIGVREEQDLWWEVPGLRYFEALTVGKVATPGPAGTFSTRFVCDYCELNAPKGNVFPTDGCNVMPAARVIARGGCLNGRLTLAPR